MNQVFEWLESAAQVLAAVPQTLVFTGGITIGLYLDSAMALSVRPTLDVDCVVEIGSKADYYRLCDRLRQIGLQESTLPGAPLCRWHYDDIQIDIMPCDESVLGFSNRWYGPGIISSIPYQLPSGRSIRLFSTPYFLASKIEAFMSRGNRSFYWSTDIEDIMLVIEGCLSLEQDVQQADDTVRTFLQQWFRTECENLYDLRPSPSSMRRISWLAQQS